MGRKTLISLTIIGAIAAITSGITTAYFSDTETSTSNTLTAGEIDLRVDDSCTYNGEVVQDCHWSEKDLTSELFFNYEDLKPGDWGENTVSLHIFDNPVWICTQISNLESYENGCNDPETKIPDITCGYRGEGKGELEDYLRFTVWRDDDCSNTQDPGEETLVSNQLIGEGSWPIADKDHGSPITETCVGIEWRLPEETGNIVQGDGLEGSIAFYAVQSRNNPDFICEEEIPDGEENPPPVETICNDDLDNDEDSLMDCNDPDCLSSPECATGESILSTSFNSYTDGDLSGQDDWIGDTYFEVQGTVVKEGTKAIQISNVGAPDKLISKSGLNVNEGRITFYGRLSALSGGAEHQFNLYEDSTVITYVKFDARDLPTGKIKYRPSAGITVYGDFSADTWHEVEIEWRNSDRKMRMRVDGGTWTSWWTPINTWSNGINKVGFHWYDTGGGLTGYWDYIDENPLP